MNKVKAAIIAGVLLAGTPMAYAEGTKGVAGEFGIFGGFNIWSGFNAESVGLIGGDARVVVPASGAFVGQFDLAFLMDPNITAPGIVNQFSGHVAAHLLYRSQDMFQAGVFGGLSASGVDWGETWTGNTVGVEAQAYLGDQLTIWAQLGVNNQSEAGTEDIRLYGGRGGVRFFFDENTRFDVDANYGAGDFDGDAASILGWGAGVEHLIDFSGVPVGLFARYDGKYFDYTAYIPGSTLTSHAVKVGARVKLGTGSLLHQDRNGPNTDVDFSSASVLDATY